MRSGNPEICNPIFCTTLMFYRCKIKKKTTTFAGPLFSLVQDKRNIIYFPPWVDVARLDDLCFCFAMGNSALEFKAFSTEILLAGNSSSREAALPPQSYDSKKHALIPHSSEISQNRSKLRVKEEMTQSKMATRK